MDIKYYEDREMSRRQSIFLAGPTPRSADVPDWRPEAIEILRSRGYDGDVYCPNAKSPTFSAGAQDTEWELEHLAQCTVILFWVPRDLVTMPAFTTNVEFGYHIQSGKVVYGRPDDAPNNEYLDYLYERHYHQQPASTLADTVDRCLSVLTK